MSSFDGLPVPGDGDQWRIPAWMGPPPGVLGGVTPLSGPVLHTANAFAGLECVTVYPTGMSLSLVLAAWRGDLDERRWQTLGAGVFPFGFDTPESSAPGPRWAVELADGAQLAVSALRWGAPGERPQPPGLVKIDDTRSSSASEVDRWMELWLWPLPHGQAISLVLTWPNAQAHQATYRIDLDAVHAALERAVVFRR